MRPNTPVSRLDAEDPWMSIWVESMAHNGGGGVPRV